MKKKLVFIITLFVLLNAIVIPSFAAEYVNTVDIIVSIFLIGSSGLVFITSVVGMFILNRRTYEANAIITDVKIESLEPVKTHDITINRKRVGSSYTSDVQHVYTYEYRDREYNKHTGTFSTIPIQNLYGEPEYKVGDPIQIMYVSFWPHKSLRQSSSQIIRTIPWITAVIAIVMAFLYAPALISLF
jgi:hypothetical protein